MVKDIKVSVKSSIIDYVTYNPDGFELKVKLKGESSRNYLYVYENVFAFTFFGFIGAVSAGKYYNEIIKKHEYQRIYDTNVGVNKDRVQLQVLLSKLQSVSDMADELTDSIDKANAEASTYLRSTAKK